MLKVDSGFRAEQADIKAKENHSCLTLRGLARVGLGACATVMIGGAAIYLAAPHPPRTPRRVGSVAELEAYLRRLVATGGPPGLSVAVVKDGAVVYDRAFGMADGPRSIGGGPDTVYHWWSMTKIATAIAVLQLAHIQAIELDAPVTNYLHGSTSTTHPLGAGRLLSATF